MSYGGRCQENKHDNDKKLEGNFWKNSVHTSEQNHTTPTLTSNIATETSLTNNNNNIPNTH